MYILLWLLFGVFDLIASCCCLRLVVIVGLLLMRIACWVLLDCVLCLFVCGDCLVQCLVGFVRFCFCACGLFWVSCFTVCIGWI